MYTTAGASSGAGSKGYTASNRVVPSLATKCRLQSVFRRNASVTWSAVVRPGKGTLDAKLKGYNQAARLSSC